jgi:threonine aldolase
VSARRGFASDNAATIHPEVLAAIAQANRGHAFGYGHDQLTERLARTFARHFGSQVLAYPVWSGTAANVLCLRAACKPWQSVICADCAHLNVDECGAPEAIAGVKLIGASSEDGKLTGELVARLIERVGDEHAVQPRVVSISQSTELGTVYSVPEIQELAAQAHAQGLALHMDGARLANAAAALERPLAALTTEVGVDLLSFGGTKNGLMGAEAVVFIDPELAEGFPYLRKQSLQLASKMRFLAAQLEALLHDELWLRNARQANRMAALLAEGVSRLDGVHITRPVQANVVFARIPRPVISTLLEQFDFYVWDERLDEVRWMCAWDTTEDDVREFVAAVGQACATS